MNPKLTLTMSGEIATDLEVNPQSVWFGQLGKGETATRLLSVKVNDPEKFKINSVAVADKNFALKRLSGDPKGNAEYEVKFRGSRKRESLSAQIQIEYQGQDKEASKITVPLRAEVVGDLRYPRYVRFMKRDGQFPVQSVVFSSRSGKPVKIKKAQDPEGLLKLTVAEPEGPNAVIRAEVADPAVEFKSPKRRSFVVETGDRDEPKVEINYMIFDQSAPTAAGPAFLGQPGAERRETFRPPVPQNTEVK